jgi:hypothetical protein
MKYDPMKLQNIPRCPQEQQKEYSNDWFRSNVLRVMSPARFRCATLLVVAGIRIILVRLFLEILAAQTI